VELIRDLPTTPSSAPIAKASSSTSVAAPMCRQRQDRRGGAPVGGRRLLAGQERQHHAHPHLRHRLRLKERSGRVCGAPGDGAAARSPQAGPRMGLFSFHDEGPGFPSSIPRDAGGQLPARLLAPRTRGRGL
jgi:hypothetical protein